MKNDILASNFIYFTSLFLSLFIFVVRRVSSDTARAAIPEGRETLLAAEASDGADGGDKPHTMTGKQK